MPRFTTHCRICSSDTKHSSGQLVLCAWREGLAHADCCRERCSLDKMGYENCPHAKKVFQKEHFVFHPPNPRNQLR